MFGSLMLAILALSLFLLHLICVCVSVYVSILWYVCEGQRRACKISIISFVHVDLDH